MLFEKLYFYFVLIPQLKKLEKLYGVYTDRHLKHCVIQYMEYKNHRLKTSFKYETIFNTEYRLLIVLGLVFAKEAIRRTIGLNVRDAQLYSAYCLYKNYVVEVGTGEGKTLISIIATFLKVLKKNTTHICTSNESLAFRDFEQNMETYNFLNIRADIITDNKTYLESKIHKKKIQSNEMVIYSTIEGFAFNYLKNELKLVNSLSTNSSFVYNYLLVDEVDDLLIDRIRLPFLLSYGDSSKFRSLLKGSSNTYVKHYSLQLLIINFIIEKLPYNWVLTNHQTYASLDTIIFYELAEYILELFNKYGLSNYSLYNLSNLYHLNQKYFVLNVMNQLIKAYCLIKKNIDYKVLDDQIIIIDEHTGRLKKEQSYSGYLQQALELKEGLSVGISPPNQISTSLQEYLLLYESWAGMSGSLKEVNTQFFMSYGKVIEYIKPSFNSKLENSSVDIFKNDFSKCKMLPSLISKYQYRSHRPVVLIDNTSNNVLKYYYILYYFLKRDLQLLYDECEDKEVDIIKNAGILNTITLSTIMIGRGVDIQLGITDKKTRNEHCIGMTRASGGLAILILSFQDKLRSIIQMSGRAARKGDPGSSKIIYGLEDNSLINLFNEEFSDPDVYFTNKNSLFYRYIKNDFLYLENVEKIPLQQKYIYNIVLNLKNENASKTSTLNLLHNISSGYKIPIFLNNIRIWYKFYIILFKKLNYVNTMKYYITIVVEELNNILFKYNRINRINKLMKVLNLHLILLFKDTNIKNEQLKVLYKKVILSWIYFIFYYKKLYNSNYISFINLRFITFLKKISLDCHVYLMNLKDLARLPRDSERYSEFFVKDLTIRFLEKYNTLKASNIKLKLIKLVSIFPKN